MGTQAVIRRLAAIGILTVLAGCASGSADPTISTAGTGARQPEAQTTTSDALGMLATALPDATPPPVARIPRATAKPKPKPKPTPRPISFYRPPGWDGHSDVDCPDFDTHAHAQSFFKGTGGTTTNDPYRLDADHDGLACESLP